MCVLESRNEEFGMYHCIFGNCALFQTQTRFNQIFDKHHSVLTAFTPATQRGSRDIHARVLSSPTRGAFPLSFDSVAVGSCFVFFSRTISVFNDRQDVRFIGYTNTLLRVDIRNGKWFHRRSNLPPERNIHAPL